jgi:hypothetical protein
MDPLGWNGWPLPIFDMVVFARDEPTLDDERVFFWVANRDDHKAEDEHQSAVFALVEQKSILLFLVSDDPGGHTPGGFQ